MEYSIDTYNTFAQESEMSEKFSVTKFMNTGDLQVNLIFTKCKIKRDILIDIPKYRLTILYNRKRPLSTTL